MKAVKKNIEIKGIFNSLDITDVLSINKIPNNANLVLNTLDNCRVVTNLKFIFFRSHGENPKMYKKEWSLNLENQIKNLV